MIKKGGDSCMIPSYKFYRAHLIKSQSDVSVEGFNFTKSEFEDLIDNFTPTNDIPILLGVSKKDLDKFCLSVYNSDFMTSYSALLAQSKLIRRKVIRKLADEGNNVALKQISEISGVGKESSQDINITVLSNVPNPDDL